MTREQLEAFAHRLKAEMEREREERNFFQLERDKLRTFWEITRDQLDEAKAEIRNRVRDVEVAQEMADTDVKHVTQQMKHLQYENKSKIVEIRAEGMTQLKLAQEQHMAQEEELLKDKAELRMLLREMSETSEMQIQQLRLKQSEEICKLNEKFALEAKDMVQMHEQKVQAIKEEQNTKNEMEMFEVDERKNFQIRKLIENHEKAFNDIKNYYNDITLNNLALISSLKEQMEDLKKQSERNERIVAETKAENKKLVEPLAKARVELTELRKKLEHYDRDRIQLTRYKTKYSTAEKQLSALNWESEALIMRNDVLVDEREKLKAKFEDAVVELQQKTGLKNVLLERQVKLLEKEAEKREAILNEAIIGTTLENRGINKMKIENQLDRKNEYIQELQYELARVCKAHDDLLATYETKLVQFGIPKEELGFEPLRTTMDIKYGRGPAGLVTKNL
ncbi:GAS8 family protein [Megaselia abdita]